MGEKPPPQQLLQLKELGSKLDNLPSSKDSLIKLLKQVATALSEVDQSPRKSVLTSMQPLINAFAKSELLKHQDREVKLLVATCICEITRITAPEAPYSDNVLKEIFQLIVSTFSGLGDTSGPSFGRRVVILETLARYRSCVVMLDLECDDLINEMFSTFLAVVSDEHPESVLNAMQTIMVVILEETEEIQEDVLFILLSVLGQNKKDIATAARRLVLNVIEQCGRKLEPGIKQFLISSISGDNRSLNCQIDYHDVIYAIYRCSPQVLSGVVPYLTGELLTDKIDIRLKAVELVGELFALPEAAISETFQPIFIEFLKRLTDRVVKVRMSVLEHVKTCLLSNPLRAEAPQIISALCDRLLDYDENVRKQVVAVICDVACCSTAAVPVGTVKLVAERLRDKSLLVKRYTLERLAEVYRIYSLNCSDVSTRSDEYDWIPGKILRCFYDKDFRSNTIESILSSSLFPTEFSVKQKIGNWVRAFSGFDKFEVKALEKILEQKQRLQQEMQKYLSLRKMLQDNDALELRKRIILSFRIMSRCFMDPVKAEENFLILDQLKDINIWKILTNLLDPNTTCFQACRFRDDVLRILGEKHRLYEFLSLLSVKCSYVLFNKEHVKEIILEAELQKSAGNAQLTLSCMNILVILAWSCPLLLSGIEENLVHLLEDENEVIKEGVLQVLAKAGGTIRDQLGVSSSSLDLILERMCLEGSRRQAKYAVHALAAITKDDGLMSLSVLYKRLVDMLEEKKHLPAVLQSLGCIAQTAMSVFETRETEIEGFIKREILTCSRMPDDKEKECFDERSELCSLKIFGIKTLVKSYLPVRDFQLRLGIDGLMGMLKNILLFGEISKDIESSLVDRAHLKLAGAKSILRLSKNWDHKIPVDLFYLTLETLQVSFPQVKKLFLNKVHQYIKDRLLDPKYACAFLYDLGSQQSAFEEEKHYLCDIIQMWQQAKARQQSLQSDAASSVSYPEYILPYVVHALAHHSSCPDVNECKDVKAFEPVYRRLHLLLSMLVHGDEDGKSEDIINKEKESVLKVISIFQGIKCSEDFVQTQKSENSHAICDLGLSIVKRLTRRPDNQQEQSMSISLPPVLYIPREATEGDEPMVSVGKTWLADGSVLAHFESLKLEDNGNVLPEIAEDNYLKESETDENEMPLGKMLKRLRAKGIQARKGLKDESLSPGMKKENDVDILKMVREIDSDNVGTSSKFEPNNGDDNAPIKVTKIQNHRKNKRMVSETTNAPLSKRRRSSSGQGHFKLSTSSSKGVPKVVRPSADSFSQEGVHSFKSIIIDDVLHSCSEEKILQDNTNEAAESDLLPSCIPKRSEFPPKHKSRRSNKDGIHKIQESSARELEKRNKLRDTDSVYSDSSPNKSVKKRKQISSAGLAKCTSKEGEHPTTDLVDCRIKIWWPMDKQFYEGVVKSYDQKKNKHVVKYNDGDVEVLCLDKERWEHVNNGRKTLKRSNFPKKIPAKGLSFERGKSSSGGSRQRKKPINMSPSTQVKGIRASRKNLKHTPKITKSSTDEFQEESDYSPQISDREPGTTFQVDESETEVEQNNRMEENLEGKEDSDKLVKSVSEGEGKKVDDAETSSSDMVESKEEGPTSLERVIKSAAGTSNAPPKGSDEDSVSGSEETLKPVLSRDGDGYPPSRVADEVGNQADDVHGYAPNSLEFEPITSIASDSDEFENSDNEPLQLWRRRAGKLVEGK